MARNDHPSELEIEKRWLLWTRTDPRKFFLFYVKYYGRILRFIYKQVLDPHLAEDLTSDTFLKAQMSLWRFRWKRVTFGAWLFRIADNEVKGHFRKRKRSRESGPFAGEGPVDPAHSPMDQVLMGETERILYRLVMGMKGVDRDIFQLRFWGGFNNRETAAIVDKPVATVKTKVRRGLIKLETIIRREYPELAEEFDRNEEPKVSDGGGKESRQVGDTDG